PDDLEFTESVAKASLREPAYDMPPPSPMDSPAILSRSTVSAVESAFNSLAHTVLSNNARTLEDLVKEMLRPMLKSWLDDNLPGLVERIVKAEIERVSRGRQPPSISHCERLHCDFGASACRLCVDALY